MHDVFHLLYFHEHFLMVPVPRLGDVRMRGLKDGEQPKYFDVREEWHSGLTAFGQSDASVFMTSFVQHTSRVLARIWLLLALLQQLLLLQLHLPISPAHLQKKYLAGNRRT